MLPFLAMVGHWLSQTSLMGVDTYVIPPQEPLHSFWHPINYNILLLVSSIMDSSLIVVGSDDGFCRSMTITQVICQCHWITEKVCFSKLHSYSSTYLCVRFGLNCWHTRSHSVTRSVHLIWISLGNIRQWKIYYCNRNIWYWWHCDQDLGTGQGMYSIRFCQPHNSTNSLLGNCERYPKYSTPTHSISRIIFLADNLHYFSLLQCSSHSTQPPIWQNSWSYTE